MLTDLPSSRLKPPTHIRHKTYTHTTTTIHCVPYRTFSPPLHTDRSLRLCSRATSLASIAGCPLRRQPVSRFDRQTAGEHVSSDPHRSRVRSFAADCDSDLDRRPRIRLVDGSETSQRSLRRRVFITHPWRQLPSAPPARSTHPLRPAVAISPAHPPFGSSTLGGAGVDQHLPLDEFFSRRPLGHGVLSDRRSSSTALRNSYRLIVSPGGLESTISNYPNPAGMDRESLVRFRREYSTQ